MPHRFFDALGEPQTIKSQESQAQSSGKNREHNLIPTGSFIVFSTHETVEKVGDKPKGELTGSKVKIMP